MEEVLAEEAERREQANARMNNSPTKDWTNFDLRNDYLTLNYLPDDEQKATFVPNFGTSLAEIFTTYLDISTLVDIWQSYPVSNWVHGSKEKGGTVNKGEFSGRLFYQYFAIYVRIVGLQNAPKENIKNKRPLRELSKVQ